MCIFWCVTLNEVQNARCNDKDILVLYYPDGKVTVIL